MVNSYSNLIGGREMVTTHKFTHEHEKYRIKIVGHSISNEDRFDFELFLINVNHLTLVLIINLNSKLMGRLDSAILSISSLID